MLPYSRPKRSDLYIPFTAAHTYRTHIWQYPPPPPPRALDPPLAILLKKTEIFLLLEMFCNLKLL